jgi:signal transduction histidine kinase
VLNAPPLMVSLDQGPLASDDDGDLATHAAVFRTLLERYLGEGRSVAVRVTGAPAGVAAAGARSDFKGFEGHGARMGMKGGRHAGAPGALSFIAQVALRDGTPVTFDARQPAQAASWPYRLLASVSLLLVAVIVVSLIAVRWATRPLNALADAADELGANINRPPMPEEGPVEVVRAAHAFNTMQSRLAGYLRERTRVFAAMSHDLKTPVTRLRLRAELLDDPRLREKFTGDLAEMESMVQATLDFLRGLESGEPVQAVDLMALLESLQSDLAETGGHVTLEGGAISPYRGRPQALKRCLANLLDNAVRYGTAARVAVNDNADRLEIRIRDEGPGIPEPELEKVAEPFYRVEGSRSRETGGTGLGLTIAKSIAEAHGGRLALRNHPEGGLEAALTLPRGEAAGRQMVSGGR